MKSLMLTNEQTANFCMAMAHLIHAGISAADALTLLKEEEQNAPMQALWETMARLADEGAPLSKAIEKSGAFPAYAAALTQVGERSGKIEQTLAALARCYESRARLDRQRRTALLYPTVLLAVLLAVAVVLLVWVLPVFNDVYARLGSELSGFAGTLLTLGGALRRGLPVLLVLAVLLGLAFAAKPVRRGLSARWNRSFGDRGADKKVLSARFVSGTAMALSSGMTAPEALALACRLSRGEAPAFEARCQAALADAEGGAVLSDALGAHGFISPADRRLLDAGRRSGKEETVLTQVADRLQEQAEEAIARRAALAEPVAVAFACVLIGAVLLSVMLPLMHIMNAIG